jgi:hypothetical protein
MPITRNKIIAIWNLALVLDDGIIYKAGMDDAHK